MQLIERKGVLFNMNKEIKQLEKEQDYYEKHVLLEDLHRRNLIKFYDKLINKLGQKEILK